MTRVHDWPSRLVAVETELQREGWAWGIHDCATATLRVVETITGTELRDQFGGDLQPRARMKIATSDLVRRVLSGAKALGLKRRDRKLLHRGDPCLVRVEGRTALAFISSRGKPAIADADGLTELPSDCVLFGWSVPA